MLFKKKKIKAHHSNIPTIIGAVLGASIFFLGFFMVSAIEKLNFEIFNFQSPEIGGSLDFLHPETPQDLALINEKEDEKISYILLIGKGGGNHDAPDLTDTIILAGINAQTQSITLLSIPRDLWVDYPLSTLKGKINGIYESNLTLGEETAMQRLQSKITEITGKKIDHYMMVDFEGFIQVVDALGGVEVSLENNFVDYEYPDGNLGYKTFILRKGTWTLDGEVALMYARSRHSSSDFDRSARQQEILSSIKKKVSNLGYLSDSKKILTLYNIFSKYVTTDMSVADMIKIGLEIRSWEKNQILSYNLNDSCYSGSPDCRAGGLLYVPLREYFGGASVLLPNKADSIRAANYKEIQQFAEYIFNFPSAFIPKKNIIIYNASGIPLLALSLAETLRPYGFVFDTSTDLQTLREKKFEKSILQYNRKHTGEKSLEILKNFIDFEMKAVSQEELINPNADIEIILTEELAF